MRKIKRTEDGSIVNDAGDYLFVSQDRFLTEVVQGSACFVCTHPIGLETREHIIPKWLQRYADISSDSITLPNGSRFRYDKYTVPCCEKCNASLGANVEAPISRAVSEGYESFVTFSQSNREVLFAWLNLLLVKTHLKDLSLREVKDLRVDKGLIADRYNWLDFHHAHAIARAALYGIEVLPEVIGSITIFPVIEFEKAGKFDYRDHSPSDSIFLRINDIAIISILNDTGKVAEMAAPRIPLEKAPNLFQTAEILTEYQAASVHLLNRPKFVTLADKATGHCSIKAILPTDIEIADFNLGLYGKLFWMNLQPFLKCRDQNGVFISDKEDEVRSGTLTFLPLKMTQ
jgi:hypothetical protein